MGYGECKRHASASVPQVLPYLLWLSGDSPAIGARSWSKWLVPLVTRAADVAARWKPSGLILPPVCQAVCLVICPWLGQAGRVATSLEPQALQRMRAPISGTGKSEPSCAAAYNLLVALLAVTPE